LPAFAESVYTEVQQVTEVKLAVQQYWYRNDEQLLTIQPNELFMYYVAKILVDMNVSTCLIIVFKHCKIY
jgi:hypothetical protein